MIRKLMTIGIVAIMAMVSLPVYAAGYIKVGDIKGESADAAHKEWSDVTSVAFGIHEPGGGAGKNQDTEPRATDIVVVKVWDKSSPKLQESVMEGKVFAVATIEQFDGEGRIRQFYELFGVKITSYSVNGSGLDDGSIPTETLSLNYEAIRFVAFPLDPDEPPVEWYHVPDYDE